MEHPFTMKSGELSLILDNDNHFHGASEIKINNFITITAAPMGNGIRIKCNDSCMKIIPTSVNEIIIDPLGKV